MSILDSHSVKLLLHYKLCCDVLLWSGLFWQQTESPSLLFFLHLELECDVNANCKIQGQGNRTWFLVTAATTIIIIIILSNHPPTFQLPLCPYPAKSFHPLLSSQHFSCHPPFSLSWAAFPCLNSFLSHFRCCPPQYHWCCCHWF